MINLGNDTRIPISQLANGNHQFYINIEPSEIDLALNYKRTIEIEVIVEKTSRQILLRVDINTIGQFSCDRCLDDFERSIPCSGNILYVYNELDAKTCIEDEVKVINTDTTYINLNDDIRDMLTLAVPLKLLCKEDCKGLCHQCGCSLNYETCSCDQSDYKPRWENLKRLLND